MFQQKKTVVWSRSSALIRSSACVFELSAQCLMYKCENFTMAVQLVIGLSCNKIP